MGGFLLQKFRPGGEKRPAVVFPRPLWYNGPEKQKGRWTLDCFDIAVLGGGAAGLFAALSAAHGAAEAGRRLKIAVLEKNPRVGKKLLATGNGRCNLTNRHAAAARYHGDAAPAAPVLERFPPEKAVEAFRSLGLICRELEGGRVYPYSLQASSVLNILRRNLESCGIETFCGFPVEKIEKAGGLFVLRSGGKAVRARRAIAATGGKACPQSGSDGDGFALLRPLGHTCTPLRPALVQIRTEPKRVRPLKGVRMAAQARLLSGGKVLKTSRGEVQFAEGALSGICIFDLSRAVGEAGGGAEISLNLAPEYGEEELARFLRTGAKALGDAPAARIAEGLLPKALGAEAVRAATGSPAAPAAALGESDIRRIARRIRDFRFPALGTLPWRNAQVTAGGIPLRETKEGLQSALCPGLFLCGEILNVDGDCGGYNLHWAWASGYAAGRAAARSLCAE